MKKKSDKSKKQGPNNDEKYRKLNHDLRERVKELNCLYGISKLVEEPGISLERIFQGTVQLIPDCWQYPETSCACITVRSQKFNTANFQKTSWSQIADIIVYGEQIGRLEVCYLEERPKSDEGPFLAEERKLIDAIGEQLGRIIEREETEQTLRKSEQKFRNLTETTSDLIWEVNKNGKYTYVNPKVKDMLGYDQKEVIGKTPFDFMPPQEAGRVKDLFKDIVDSRQSFAELENTNIHKDGRYVVLETSGIPVLDTQGQLKGYRGIDRDITERKHAERVYETIIQTALDGFWICDMNGRMLDINDSACQMLGYNRQELLAMSISDIEAIEDNEQIIQHIRKIIKQGYDRFESKHRCKDGKLIDVEISTNYLDIGEGRFFVFVREITERKHTEEQLKKAHRELELRVQRRTAELARANENLQKEIEEHKQTEEALAGERHLLRTLIDLMPDYIYVKDIQSRFLLANTAVAEYMGAETSDDLISKTDHDFYSKESADEYYADEQQIIASEKPLINKEETSVDSENKARWSLTTKVPLRDSNKNIVGLVGISRDITERKRAADALQKARDELEIRVKERTAELAKANEALLIKIDEHRQTEEQLRESEKKYRLLFDSNPHPMWVYDIETLEFLAVNDTAIKCYGYSRKEFLKMTITDIRPPEDIPALLKSISNIKPGVDFGGVWRHKNKTGTIFFVETIAHTITWESRPAEIVLTIDITERKHAEEQLKKAHSELELRVQQRTAELAKANKNLQKEIEEHKQTEEALTGERYLLRTLIDIMPDYIYVKDTQGQFLLANTALAKYIGAETSDDLISKTDHDFYPKELADEYYADEQQIIASEKPLINKEETSVDSENKARWSLTTKVPLRDSNKNIVGLVGISRDITERKRARDELQKARDELEIRVKKRTAELAKANEALLIKIDEHRQAEEARDKLNIELALRNEELESILYVASHDLRSPLVNIQGFSYELSQSCELIRSALGDMKIEPNIEKKVFTALNETVPESLGFILTSASKMDTVLLGLLRLSRLGREATNVVTLDMNELIANIVASVEYQAKEAGATIKIDPLPSCHGDASQITQVFSNLLDNAIKYLDYSRPGKIQITGRVKEGLSIYCVEDNGVGISTEHQGKIFEAFHRLEPDARGWGEGLGLTIVQRILEMHNGKVWVEAVPGRGSRFFVVLDTA